VSAESVREFRDVDVAHEAIIDAERAVGVLSVRSARPGDRFYPLGAPGSRKLKEIYIDLQVPSRERPTTPLVVCDERIIWVCGLVVSEEVKVTPATKRFLRLSVAPNQDGVTG
jgi:tRNA(Ile)-lysidine synthase